MDVAVNLTHEVHVEPDVHEPHRRHAGDQP
jgi:hypothetical protein